MQLLIKFRVTEAARVIASPAHRVLKRYDANHYSIEMRNKRTIKH